MQACRQKINWNLGVTDTTAILKFVYTNYHLPKYHDVDDGALVLRPTRNLHFTCSYNVPEILSY